MEYTNIDIIEILGNKNKPVVKNGVGQLSISERRNSINNALEKKNKTNETNKQAKTIISSRESGSKTIDNTKNKATTTNNMQNPKSYATVAARIQKNSNNSTSKNETPRREAKTNEMRKKVENKKVDENMSTDAKRNEQNDTQNIIIIKPKKNQECNETINDINKKFNPAELAINRINKMRNGMVKICCDKADKLNLLKNYIKNELKDGYEIMENRLIMPKIKICGLTEKLDTHELEQQIKRQNGILADSELQVLKVTEDIKHKDTFNAIIRIDKHSFNEVIKRKKVMINWDCCAVKEHLSMMRCHNCSGFNHTKDICINKTACGYCGREHDSRNCDSGNLNCINCIIANEKYTLDLNTNHHVWSKQCEILNNKLNKIIKKTEYEIEK